MDICTSTPLGNLVRDGLGTALIILGGLIGWTPTRLALLSLFGRKHKHPKKRSTRRSVKGGRK